MGTLQRLYEFKMPVLWGKSHQTQAKRRDISYLGVFYIWLYSILKSQEDNNVGENLTGSRAYTAGRSAGKLVV